ncbi:MAG: invasion associated locus B family protein [Alphaproteobacteria bacterium]
MRRTAASTNRHETILARTRAALLAATMLCLGAAGTAHAEDPRFIGDFGAWAAYTYTIDGAQVCYIASKPTASRGDYERRGDVFALVTHRMADGVIGEVSVVAGYEYQADNFPRAQIGGDTFEMFARGDTAWLRADEDTRMVAAMRRGTEMVVTGTSSRGTNTTDTFSLMGFTRAHEAITRVCRKN